MLSFMSDRRVLSVSAALITAAIFLFLLGTYPSWRAAIREGITWSHDSGQDVSSASARSPNGSAPSQPTAPAQALSPIAPSRSVTQPGQTSVSAPTDQSSASAPSAPAQSVQPALSGTASAGVKTPDRSVALSGSAIASAAPTFDIVRVEPTGESVVAARAKAGVPVVLLDSGRPIARAQADASGQVAFVPPVLAPGEHSLMLSVGEPNTPGALSSQSVAVSVPADAKAPPMVALIQPDQPTRILSEPHLPMPAVGVAPAPAVSVSTMDVEEMGGVYAAGKAPPGSHCRVYLNGSFVAPVTAGPDGRWSLKIERGMKPGHYAVRVDQIGPKDGSVQARAEVPFDYPATLEQSVSLLRPKIGTATAQGAATSRSAASLAAPPVHGTPTSAGPQGGAGSQADAVSLAAPVSGAGPIGTPSQDGAGALASASTQAGSSTTDAATPTVVEQLLTTKVVRGDSLWRISRKVLGHGRHYTQIYAANTSQIRDPRWIYPGQIFVMPQGASTIQ